MTPGQYRKYEREFQPLLGRLFANVSAFESRARIALYLIVTPPAERRSMSWKITDLQVGDAEPVDHITSFVYLSSLIDEWNARNASDDSQQIDAEIIDLRNALAHGRMLAPTDYGIMVLTHFGKPDKATGLVRVVARHEMTLDCGSTSRLAKWPIRFRCYKSE